MTKAKELKPEEAHPQQCVTDGCDPRQPDGKPPDSNQTATMGQEGTTSNVSLGRWRIVGAWTSLRKSFDATRPTDETLNASISTNANANAQRPVSHHHDSAGETMPLRPPRGGGRKRVSLFLRRRRSAQPFQREEHVSTMSDGDGDSDGEAYLPDETKTHHVVLSQNALRRAKSNVVHPVSLRNGNESERVSIRSEVSNANASDEGFQGAGLERLAAVRIIASESGKAAHDDSAYHGGQDDNGAGKSSSSKFDVDGCGGDGIDDENGDDDDGEDAIIGEICLEDFADLEVDDDYEFLDGQSIDLSFEPVSTGTMGRLSTRPSLKLDNNTVRWIGDEKEFAKFFAEVGLDDLLDGNEEQWAVFRIDDGVVEEWRAAGEEHNRRCEMWAPLSSAHSSPMDIRDLARDFNCAASKKR